MSRRLQCRACHTKAARAHLFSYINGSNVSRQKVAMTAPVIQTAGSSQKLAMTAPVFARFDPPFKPWFLRRNEVVQDVKEPKSVPGTPDESGQVPGR